VPKYVAKRYAGRIRRGGILMPIHCDSQEWCNKAKQTLKDTGARNKGATAEVPADYATADKPTERAPSTVTNRISGLRVTDASEPPGRVSEPRNRSRIEEGFGGALNDASRGCAPSGAALDGPHGR
jgi:hypothetical protein